MCHISYSGEWEQAQYSYGNYGQKTTEISAGFPKKQDKLYPRRDSYFTRTTGEKREQFCGKQGGWELQLSPEGHLLHNIFCYPPNIFTIPSSDQAELQILTQTVKLLISNQSNHSLPGDSWSTGQRELWRKAIRTLHMCFFSINPD